MVVVEESYRFKMMAAIKDCAKEFGLILHYFDFLPSCWFAIQPLRDKEASNPTRFGRFLDRLFPPRSSKTYECIGGIEWTHDTGHGGGSRILSVEAWGDPSLMIQIAEKLEQKLGEQITVMRTRARRGPFPALLRGEP